MQTVMELQVPEAPLATKAEPGMAEDIVTRESRERRHRVATEWTDTVEAEAKAVQEAGGTKAFVAWARDRGYMKAYEDAVYVSGRLDAPSWAELTEEQRAHVRDETKRMNQEFAELGRSLSEENQASPTSKQD